MVFHPQWQHLFIIIVNVLCSDLTKALPMSPKMILLIYANTEHRNLYFFMQLRFYGLLWSKFNSWHSCNVAFLKIVNKKTTNEPNLSGLNTPWLLQGSKTCLILKKQGEPLNFNFFFLKKITECNIVVKRNTNHK